ncbi:hypothetical protein BDV19DRAFT_367962 [Aspergillus venezuelensis]
MSTSTRYAEVLARSWSLVAAENLDKSLPQLLSYSPQRSASHEVGMISWYAPPLTLRDCFLNGPVFPLTVPPVVGGPIWLFIFRLHH